jgi:hypothetical protein
MNYMSVTLLLLVSLLCPLISSCSGDKPTNTDSRPPAIYGRLLDSAGNPVADAGVSLLFHFTLFGNPDTSGSFINIGPDPVVDRGSVNFLNPVGGHVKLQILRAHTRAIVLTLIDTVLPMGGHTVEFQTNDIPNQGYLIRMEAVRDTMEKLFIINNPDLPNHAPFVRTDGDGRFTIYYSTLPLGRSFQQFFDNGAAGGKWRVGDSLYLAMDGPEKADRIWKMKVDTTTVVDSTLRLP